MGSVVAAAKVGKQRRVTTGSVEGSTAVGGECQPAESAVVTASCAEVAGACAGEEVTGAKAMDQAGSVLVNHAHGACAIGSGKVHISSSGDGAAGEVPAGIAFHNGARSVGVCRCIGQQFGEVDVGSGGGAHIGNDRGPLGAGDIACKCSGEAACGGRRRGTRCSGGVPSEGTTEGAGGGATKGEAAGKLTTAHGVGR